MKFNLKPFSKQLFINNMDHLGMECEPYILDYSEPNHEITVIIRVDDGFFYSETEMKEFILKKLNGED